MNVLHRDAAKSIESIIGKVLLFSFSTIHLKAVGDLIIALIGSFDPALTSNRERGQYKDYTHVLKLSALGTQYHRSMPLSWNSGVRRIYGAIAKQ